MMDSLFEEREERQVLGKEIHSKKGETFRRERG